MTMSPWFSKRLTHVSNRKIALQRWFAVERLRQAARAILEENTEVAKSSFAQPGAPWSDAMWRSGDENNAKLCIELRRALKEIDRTFPVSAKGKIDGR